MADYNDIKQSIATNLPDNNKREITAARLRDTLNGFVDKVQETETGIEGKVSTNESNIGNLSGRMDTNEANVTNLTGRVDTLEQTVENLPGGGDTVKVVDDLGLGGAKDAVSARCVNTVAALVGMHNNIINDDFKTGKATVHSGYLNIESGNIEEVSGYSYFEYDLSFDHYQYVTLPAYGDKVINALPEGKKLGVIFYSKQQGTLTMRGYFEYERGRNREDVYLLDIRVPGDTNMIHVSLIDGTFDPADVYVTESNKPSLHWRLDKFDDTINKQALPREWTAAIGSNALYDDDNKISVVRLLKNDEIEVEIESDRGGQLAHAYSDYMGANMTLVYPGGWYEYQGWIYYKANDDCYVFIGGGNKFQVRHNGFFGGDEQYQLESLITKLKPSYGDILLDTQGKGHHQRWEGGTKIVFRVPIVAGTTLNYTLHSTGTFTLGNVAYYYSGQPVATADIENQATFSANVLGIVGGTKSGYMLVTFAYSGEGDIPAEIFNATYLEKNAQ